MARRGSNQYKPPFLMIRYIEQLESVQVNTSVQKKLVTVPGKNCQSKNIETGINSTGNKVNNITSDNVNSNLSKSSTRNWDCQEARNIDAKYSSDPTKTITKIGWAVIRPNNSISGATSLLPVGDNRLHILARNPILNAFKTVKSTDDNSCGVDYVYPTTGPGDITPISTAKNYKGTRVEKFLKGQTATGPEGVTTGANNWQTIILDSSASGISTGYVVVKYYADQHSIITENMVQTVVQPDTTENLTADINITSINRALINEQKIFTLDLYKVATYSAANKKFGFGVERFDFAGDSRKSIQQTRGKININNIDTVQDNFYVDTWWKSPETIVLSGVVELPHAYEEKVSDITYSNTDKKPISPWESFYTTMESFFEWNNNPMRINRGDKLQFVDYYESPEDISTAGSNPNKTKVYDVTFKSRKFSQSVEKQGILSFEFNFTVLGRSSNG